ncbi:small nuclear RNA activating complex, polypeptide 3 [Thoreauomyces humboldtii]|nr:small nuclear RNA activating complex, polypeptide 3 [Thoreauomyces humboldtii]
MHDTTFADLAPTANTSSVRPYMFVHQGSCAHSVTFGDLIPAAVPNDTTAYPIQLPSAPGPDPRERIKKCQLCSKGKAEWVTVQDQRADRDFCLWCSSCFEAFHLEQDGSLAYDVEYHRVELPDL